VEGVDPILCELVDGTLVEKPIGLRESLIAVFLGGEIRQFVVARNLGIVTGTDGTLKLWEGLIRLPDVAYVSWDRIPGRQIPAEPVPNIAPDLAVEVLSQSNTRREMERKRGEYFAAGVRLVWEIDPNTRTVAVYTAPDTFVTLQQSDVLDGGSVLSGFAIPLTELFGELDRHG
jgi:Uma2 family endonuclease